MWADIVAERLRAVTLNFDDANDAERLQIVGNTMAALLEPARAEARRIAKAALTDARRRVTTAIDEERTDIGELTMLGQPAESAGEIPRRPSARGHHRDDLRGVAFAHRLRER